MPARQFPALKLDWPCDCGNNRKTAWWPRMAPLPKPAGWLDRAPSAVSALAEIVGEVVGAYRSVSIAQSDRDRMSSLP